MVNVVSSSLLALYTHFLYAPSLADVKPWEIYFAFRPNFLEHPLSHFLNCLWDIYLSLALQLHCYDRSTGAYTNLGDLQRDLMGVKSHPTK
jgi:hypothetical protein